jgi:hypothetical protein
MSRSLQTGNGGTVGIAAGPIVDGVRQFSLSLYYEGEGVRLNLDAEEWAWIATYARRLSKPVAHDGGARRALAERRTAKVRLAEERDQLGIDAGDGTHAEPARKPRR